MSVRNYTEIVQALLAKAENKATTPEERALYQGKALELMAKHSISEALVRGVDPKLDPIVRKTVRFAMPHSRAVAFGFYLITELMDVPAILARPDHTSKFYGLMMYGRESVLANLEQLLLSLTMQAHTDLHAHYKGRSSTRVESRNFVQGWTSAVAYKVKVNLAVQKGGLQKADADRYALVLVSDLEKANALKKKQHPQTRKGRMTGMQDNDSRAHGHAAGRKADIGQNKVGSGRKAIGA